MNYEKLNCKTCGYEYCPFHGLDREISAYFCEDYRTDHTDLAIIGKPEEEH